MLAGNIRQSSTTQSIKLGKYGHSDYLKARHGSLGQVRHAFEGGGCQESQELKLRQMIDTVQTKNCSLLSWYSWSAAWLVQAAAGRSPDR